LFSTDWTTSPRQYNVITERDVRVPVDDGITLDCDIFRPDAPGKFPVILTASPYDKAAQSEPMVPKAIDFDRAFIEAGDFNFFTRRGYVYVIMNIRGSWASDGVFANRNPDARAIQDLYEAIEWLARQDWCDGNVGMSGVSYFSVVQKRVAVLKPPSLKCIFAPYGWTDGYRDLFYHGGIFSYGFFQAWATNRGAGLNIDKDLKAEMGDNAYNDALETLRNDPEIMAIPFLAGVVNNPETDRNPMVLEILIHRFDDAYHRERAPDFSAEELVPAYLGADWGMFGFHMPGDVRAFENWNGPKKFVMGPPIYLDRPVYQYAWESLRWFDYWLKGNDTKIMEEPPVKLFITGTGEWKMTEDWPVPGTRWTPFYLHKDGILSEHEFWPDDTTTTYDDSPEARGSASFTTPPMVEHTEICGPIVLNFYGSTTDTEVLWFASLWVIDTDGAEQMLTRGWLRGSQRKLDETKSKPWKPIHEHSGRESLTPGEVYEFNMQIRPYGILLTAGQRLKLKIASSDNEVVTNFNERTSRGHLLRPNASSVTIHHNHDAPSHLLLPITRGNVMETFFSGGVLPRLDE
jgi:predicted acyl esterase